MSTYEKKPQAAPNVVDASDVTYDNSGSGLSSTDIQSAIDETYSSIGSVANPILFKGSIAAASDFPTSADVEIGWFYAVTADVTDNDATKTNTGDSFSENDEIVWNGTAWVVIGNTSTSSETDPVVGAVNGIVKADGAGNISAAVAGTDYQGVLTEGAFVDGDKNRLDGIEDGAEVNNISDVNATDLTDGGDSSLHYHSTDRNRANHTGTQTASTISDFDTEVSNNTDVSANTSARHSEVTVTDSSEIDFTLTGQEITASLKSGSIDETKLDTSVNSSLDKADSALQDVVDDTTPQLGGQLDVNGNALGDGTLELLKFEETASAVNEITIKNNSTGNAPEIKATGDDTNIDLKLVPKGTGGVDLGDKNLKGAGSIGFTQELDNGSKTASFSIDFSTDQKQKVTLTANTMTLTLDTTNIKVGNYLLKIVNGGLATLTWAAESGSIYWAGGSVPTFTSSGTDLLACYYDGTNFYLQAALGFATV